MRTQVGHATLQLNGLWSVTLETWAGPVGDEYLSSRVTSAGLFETEDSALAAGNRALDHLEQTGLFPDMCRPF